VPAFFCNWPENPEKGLQQGIKLVSAFHCTPVRLVIFINEQEEQTL
jgi:hypothetical protein